MKTVIMFGTPGAGKGTQSELIAKKKNYVHLSTGDALRNEVASGSDLGKRINGLISKGHFAPDEMMIEMIEKFFDKHPNQDIILDGFPRNVNQAGELYNMLGKINREQVYVVNLEIGDDEAVKRLLLRAKSQGRSDDNEIVIRKRLKIYHADTKPILEFYTGKYPIYNVNGVGPVSKINKEIIRVLN